MKTLLVLVVAIGAVVAFQQHRKAGDESRLAAIAGEIAGRDVSVHCQGSVGAALDVTAESGSVQFDPDGRPASVAELKRPICKRLAAFGKARRSARFACLDRPTSCDRVVVESAVALNVLAHEAWHLSGQMNEAVTECYAEQTIGFVATKLGSDDVEARGLARLVHLLVYPRMPDDYRSSECREGGALDLRPESTAWPS